MNSLLSDDESSEVGLYFVIPQEKSKEECSDVMKEAFKISVENDLSPSWKEEENCMTLSPSKRNVFVFERFKGPAFTHLKTFKCVLVGPLCLISCLMAEERLPIVSYPTFTAAMRNLVITSSGGGVELKKEIKDKVECMAGIYLKNFTEKTTHLVVSSVASTKYEKALELGVPVMTSEWVEAVWKTSQEKNVLATDKIFDRFKCPPFLQLRVCSSGLNVRSTERIKSLVTNNGGIYETSLCQSINVLVVRHPKGDKFKYAQSWSIPCVDQKWIFDSVQNGHALPTKTYEIAGRATSSPTSDRPSSVSFSVSDVSNIQFDNRTHVDETLLDSTTASTASFCPPVNQAMPPPTTPVKRGVQASGPTPKELKYLLRELDLSQTMKAGSFLDGCGVFLYGWDSEEEEKLRRILKCSGAARFSDLSDRVSHVLVGNLDKPFIRTLKGLSHRPHVINIKWLIQSVSEKGPAIEDPYSCMPNDTTTASEAPSPLSKKGMALLQRENISPIKPRHPLPSEREEKSPNKGQLLLAKYMSSDLPASGESPSKGEAMRPPLVPTSYERLSHDATTVRMGAATSNNFTSSESQDETNLMIFSGYKFVIVGLAEEAAQYVENELILKYGGEVVSKSFKGVPDYAVVPLTGATLHQTATDIVTNLWLEDCVSEHCICPINYYHQPVVLNLSKKPLKGCVLGTSGYTGSERQFIIELATALGAIVQDCFAKISKTDKLASTHLICLTSENSPKYEAAVKWFRPAVRHTWLLDCASLGTLVPEKSHLLNKDQIIKPLEILDGSTANESLVNKIETPPYIAALKKLPCFKTPEQVVISYDKEKVERILNYEPSPDKYDVRTPPVPMGLSENPSPGESKRYQKWINRLPGPLPPSPKRRDSTPLHELRRRILHEMAAGSSKPEMVDHVPPSEGGDEDMPESANAMMVQNKGNSSFKTAGTTDSLSACSTPTTSNTNPSRKLFDRVNNEIHSPIDGPLDKLKKLIETPEVPVEKSFSSVKSASRNQHIVVETHETQLLSDSLKDGSQPYAIKWEDPVNLARNSKDGFASPLKQTLQNNTDQCTSFKRKSSESADSEPQIKKQDLKDVQQVPKSTNSTKSYAFFLSCSGDRTPYIKIISKLGGTFIDSSHYNPKATHLLLEKTPQRSEKLLGCIASGKWILHISYLIESDKQGKFLEEEDFEWGNPRNSKLMKSLKAGTVDEALAKAAYRWRTSLATSRAVGAFEGFKCKIFVSEDKLVAFKRLICAGGGEVLSINSQEEPSFCLINASAKNVDLLEFVKKDIPCLPLTFIYEHLTANPRPDPKLSALEEYKKLRREYLAKTSKVL